MAKAERLYAAKGGQLAMWGGAKALPSSHANRGMELERALSVVHEHYARTGEALVGKQYVPTQVVKGGEWARVIGRSTVDYVGVVKGGRLVAFDAKDCGKDRIELGRLQGHQLEYLQAVERLGGLAFVLTRFPSGVWVIPIRAWKAAVAAREGGLKANVDGWTATGKASIGAGELPEGWKVQGVDWLATVMKMQDCVGKNCKNEI